MIITLICQLEWFKQLKMTTVHTSIKTAYEVNDMTPEEISEDQDLDIACVKAALMQCSSKYRKACGIEEDNEDGLNFTNDELRRVNQVIFEAAISAEGNNGNPDWRVRSQNAQYIRDDKKGRKEAVKHMAGNVFNILSFNEQLQKARELSSSMKQQLIEI